MTTTTTTTPSRRAERHGAYDAIMKAVTIIAVIGAVNWGLIGLFNFNLVDAIFGGGAREETSGLSRVIYALVGLCGLAALGMLPRMHASRR